MRRGAGTARQRTGGGERGERGVSQTACLSASHLSPHSFVIAHNCVQQGSLFWAICSIVRQVGVKGVQGTNRPTRPSVAFPSPLCLAPPFPWTDLPYDSCKTSDSSGVPCHGMPCMQVHASTEPCAWRASPQPSIMRGCGGRLGRDLGMPPTAFKAAACPLSCPCGEEMFRFRTQPATANGQGPSRFRSTPIASNAPGCEQDSARSANSSGAAAAAGHRCLKAGMGAPANCRCREMAMQLLTAGAKGVLLSTWLLHGLARVRQCLPAHVGWCARQGSGILAVGSFGFRCALTVAATAREEEAPSVPGVHNPPH